MAQYAQRTEVSAEKSRGEIERILVRYGADQFIYGWEADSAVLGFRLANRHVKFFLPLPDRKSREFTTSHRGVRSPDAAAKLYDQACRQRWRALALVIKAKLEAVECGITTFEDEFLAHILLPDGQRVGRWLRPQIAIAYERGDMPALLPAPQK